MAYPITFASYVAPNGKGVKVIARPMTNSGEESNEGIEYWQIVLRINGRTRQVWPNLSSRSLPNLETRLDGLGEKADPAEIIQAIDEVI